MKNEVGEIEAKLILDRADREVKARGVLSENAYPRYINFVLILIISAPSYWLQKFEAPYAVTILISFGFGFAVFGCVEFWSIRRRLEAAIELLKLRDE